MDLLDKIKAKQAVVGIIGLGYVGLPLVLRFCEVGFQVLGFDTDASKVERLNRGESYIQHIPSSRLAALLTPREGAGQFAATHDLGRLGEPDVLIICVPTPLTSKREPDLRYVEEHHPADCRLPAPRPAGFVWNPPPTPAPPRNCFCPSWALNAGWGRIFTWSSLPNGKTRATPPSR